MGCGGRSKQRPYETGDAKTYDGLSLPGTFVRAIWRCGRRRKSKEPALRKGLWVNPFGMNSFGIHETGPALRKAKPALRKAGTHPASFNCVSSEFRWRAGGLASGGYPQKMSVHFSGVEGLATRPRYGAATGARVGGGIAVDYNFEEY
jgi:hypothetical protein